MLRYATNEQKVQNLFKVMILYLFVKIYTEMLFYANYVIFARQTYIVKPILSNLYFQTIVLGLGWVSSLLGVPYLLMGGLVGP